jgi:hypothetical protein
VTALSISCAFCGTSLNIHVEEDGMYTGLRKDGDPPLMGGQGILHDSKSRDGEDPIDYKDFVETVTSWKEELEEAVKKGVVPKAVLKKLITAMDKALDDGMDRVERGDGELTVEVQPFGH